VSRSPTHSPATRTRSGAPSPLHTDKHASPTGVTTALVAAELGLGGVWDIRRTPYVRDVIDRLGYPTYFLTILGVWKLLGAVALTAPRLPRLKEWAYAGAIFTYTGAVASHLATDDVDAGTFAFLIAMTGLTGASWKLRPPARRDFPALRTAWTESRTLAPFSSASVLAPTELARSWIDVALVIAPNR